MGHPRSLRLTRNLVLLALLVLPGVSPAHAQSLPDPRFCVVEERVVGCPSGDPLAACPSRPLPQPGFAVRVRDVFNAPLANRPTSLRFTDPAIRLYEDVRPGTTVDCINREITRTTDSEGWVVFAPRIGDTSAFASVEIWCNGILLATVPVTTTDLDGDGLTGLSDFVVFAANYGSNPSDRRTDYDGCIDPVDGATTLSDFVIFASQFGRPAPQGICF